MTTIKEIKHIPAGSIILDGMNDKVDYSDIFFIEINSNKNLSVDYLTALFFTASSPAWVETLIKLRKILVKPFGLKAEMPPEQRDISPSMRYNKGEKAVFFTIVERNDSEIVISENDKHLIFRFSTLLESNPVNQIFYITTIVKYHNLLGRCYFTLIKLFHRELMKMTLRAVLKQLNK